MKDVAPKDLRKTFSWYKWHFSSWTVECCSCRAAEQPTLVVSGPRGPGTVCITARGGSGGILSHGSVESRQTQAHPALKECQELLLTQKNGYTLMHFATLGPLWAF